MSIPSGLPHRRRVWPAGRFNRMAAAAGLMCAAMLAVSACGTPDRPVLTRAAQVLRLSDAEADRGYPVRLNGVVTFVDSVRGILVVQDSTAGVSVALADPETEARQGQRVAIEGTTNAERPYPVIAAASLIDQGSGSLPSPRLLGPADLVGNAFHDQWVDVHGVVRSVAVGNDGRLALEITSGGRVVSAHVLSFRSAEITNLVDADVRIQGIARSLLDARGNPVRNELLVQDLADITTVLSAREDPFDVPVIAAPRLTEKDPVTNSGHRIRMRGTVVRREPGGGLVLRDATGEVRVFAMQIPPVQPGDRLDVVGFPEFAGGELVLQEALFRPAAVQAASTAKAEHPAPGSAERVLTRIDEIKALRPEEARLGRPVHIRATVTFYDPDWNLLFVQDDTDGIYVSPHGQKPFGIDVGDRVEITGKSAPGDYAPIIVEPHVTYLGKGRLPARTEDRVDYLFAGRQDARWAEVEGVVRSVRVDKHETGVLDLVSGTRRLTVVVPLHDGAVLPDGLVDARVRVRGVCGTIFNSKRQLVGIRFFTPALAFIDVLIPGAEDPFAVPLRAVDELFVYTPEEMPGHQVRVEGTVTYQGLDAELYVNDPTGGVRVKLARENRFEPGDRVEVVGFPAPGPYTPVIEDAWARKIGAAPEPLPVSVTAAEAFSGNFDGRVIRIEAYLVEHYHGYDKQELTLQAGDRHFHATVPWPGGEDFVNSLPNGTLLQLTGVCMVDMVDEQQAYAVPRSFNILLRSPDDVVVVESAPQMTLNHLGEMLALMGVVVILALAWVLLLRRRVRQQTGIIRTKLREEAALKEAAEAASQAKSHFLSAVSHELRTPLTAILGYADILQEEMDGRIGTEQMEHIQTIRSSGERLLGLVNGLLDLSAAEAGRLQVNVCAVAALAPVYDVVREIHPLAESKGVALAIDDTAGDLWVCADESRLRQVLTNLVSNAVKFTEEGYVSIGISEGVLTDDDGREQRAVAFTVRDTGAGIAPDFMPHLFDQFTQDQRAQQNVAAGTGLGLSISQELVTRMGGIISVDTQVGRGTMFTVLLPRAESAAYAPVPALVHAELRVPGAVHEDTE